MHISTHKVHLIQPFACRRSEKQYRHELFEGATGELFNPLLMDPSTFSDFLIKVVLFGFGDHQAPPFELLVQFCKDAKTWLDKDTSNVVVIHCKAGKGRTGTMIAALLLYLGYATDADEAIQVYGTKRTTDGKVCGMDGFHQFFCLLNMQFLGHHYPKPDTICPLL